MMNRHAIAVLLLSACTTLAPEPEILRVTPDEVFNDVETRIDIAGRALYPDLGLTTTRQVADGEPFVVRLWPIDEPDAVPVALDVVRSIDVNTISGVVPSGMDPGRYDVEVTSPFGGVGRGRGLLQVRDTRASALRLSVDQATWDLGETAAIRIEAVDRQGEPVAENLEVDFTIVTRDGTVAAGSLSGEGFAGTEAIQDVEGGLGVRGELGQDGVAIVQASITTEGDVEVAVRPSAQEREVQPDDLVMNFRDPSGLKLEVLLADEPPEGVGAFTAGDQVLVVVQIVDADGDVQRDREAQVVLEEVCGGSVVGIADLVAGVAGVRVPVRTATTTGLCASSAVRARWEVGLGAPSVTAQTAPFQVMPAAPDHVAVSPLADGGFDARVGELVDLELQLEDVYDNPTPWPGGEIVTVANELGGLEIVTSCARRTSATWLVACEARWTTAGAADRLSILRDDAPFDTTSAFAVSPGPIDRLEIDLGEVPWRAGETRSVGLDPVDAFGNAVTTAVVDGPTAQVVGAGAPVDCTGQTDGTLSCSTTQVFTGRTLSVTATVQDGSASPVVVSGASVPFAALNGPLHTVTVTPDATEVTSGEGVAVTFAAFDAWDNPVRDGLTRDLELEASEGPISPGSLVLGATGQATVAVTLFRAGATRIRALQDDDVVGESPVMSVRAGASDRFEIDVLSPWTWTQLPTEVVVTAVDAFGNRAALDGSVTLTSSGGRFSSVTLPIVQGRALTSLTWTSWSLGDLVLASGGGGLAGSSAPFLVVRNCADGGPTLATDLGTGLGYARECVDPLTGTAVVEADFSPSEEGFTPFARYGVAVDGSEDVVSSDAFVEVEVPGVGVWPITLLAAQSDGCAESRQTRAWVGPDDGTPVGPITLTAQPTAVSLDGAVTSSTIALSGLRTCDGSTPAPTSLRTRTDRGRLLGPGLSGSGLTVLASGGQASWTWSAGDAPEGGQARVLAWHADGELAFGTTSLSVSGDRRSPVVWSHAPRGRLLDPTSTITLTFSETLDPNTVIREAFFVTGPGVVTVDSAVLHGDGRTIVLTTDQPLAGGPSPWTIGVEGSLTDAAGNRLAGNGLQADTRYLGVFGPTGTAPEVAACEPSLDVFRPDGDPGPGEEADEITLSAGAFTQPTAWWVSVLDADATLLRRQRLVATGATMSWSFDGRDQTGAVLPTGAYTLVVRTEASNGAWSAPCQVDVSIDLPTAP